MSKTKSFDYCLCTNNFLFECIFVISVTRQHIIWWFIFMHFASFLSVYKVYLDRRTDKPARALKVTMLQEIISFNDVFDILWHTVLLILNQRCYVIIEIKLSRLKLIQFLIWTIFHFSCLIFMLGIDIIKLI